MCRESTVCCVWPCLLWFFQSNVSFCRRILLKPMPHNSEPLYDNWYTVQYFSYIHFDFTVSTVYVCVWVNKWIFDGTRWAHIWCLFRTMLFEQSWLSCVCVCMCTWLSELDREEKNEELWLCGAMRICNK